MNTSRTIGELRKSGYLVRSVQDEVRTNLIRKLQEREQLFPGIVGYDQTVIPSIVNALLAKHDLLLLGLRGQAKSRIVRMLPSLLDETIPCIKGCEINDNPYKPVCKRCCDLVAQYGDEVEIDWLPRERRFGEKLATPDVTIADLIGDIDPMKAAAQRLHYSHEGAIHFGIIPRTNRGIFAINELPDLQPRIQVGLFNIMEERDIQIRGFHVRIPLDVMIVFTANPEDYTNRGNLITPLKDRIDSQIITHYPLSLEDSMRITEQEAWLDRDGRELILPTYFKEIVDQAAVEARKSEYIDQKSGVSARFTITAMENLISNAERRAILLNDPCILPRICDFPHALPGMTGKVELVFEGEQEGAARVGKALIGKAVREIFKQYFPDPLKRRKRKPSDQSEQEDSVFSTIIRWFEDGNSIRISDEMTTDHYFSELNRVQGLREITMTYLKLPGTRNPELASAMEFVLDGLHQSSRIAKDEVEHHTTYADLVGRIFNQHDPHHEEDFLT